jgi:DNA-binding beta-propeller fold protein YncE
MGLSAMSFTIASADARAASPARFVRAWGKRGNGPGEFNFPVGIVVSRDGSVLVTDFYNARVQRFNSDGKFLSSFAVLPNPGGLAEDRDGNLYITHFSAMKLDELRKPDRVSVVDRHGKLLRQWGATGSGDGQFDYPGGIAVSPTGQVYVADQTNRRVQVFDSEGKFLFKWGEYGTAHGQFGGNITPKSRVGGPQFVALDRSGNVYTTEGSLGRVQKFTERGEFLSAWGDNSDKPGSFGGGYNGIPGALQGPVGVCIDDGGRIWVSAAGGRVQQFTADGMYIRGLAEGDGAAPGRLVAPHGIAVDRHGSLYVADSFNHRVLKFAVPR